MSALTVSSAAVSTPPVSAPLSTPVTSTPVASPSTLSSLATSSPAQSPAASGTGSPSSSNNTGYKAAVGALGGVLAIALVLIGLLIFLLLRQRKSRPREVESKHQKSDTSELQATITDLRRRLDTQNEQLKGAQVSLIENGRKTNIVDAVDDRTLNNKAVQLSRQIQDLVLSNFNAVQDVSASTPELESILAGIANYREYLQDNKTKFLVIRSVIAQLLVRDIKSGELLGPSYAALYGTLSRGSVKGYSKWRSETVHLLRKSGGFEHEVSQAIQNTTRKIAQALRCFNERFGGEGHLREIVAAASDLALDLAGQVSTYDLRIEKDGYRSFVAASMDDVLQQAPKASQLEGRTVFIVVFPGIVRLSNGAQDTSSHAAVISKALVYV